MAGRKTFVAGAVLTAADVNDYLMDQAVMTFATSDSRASAIAAPTEGMVTLLTDTDSMEIYDGTGWVSVNNSTVNTQAGTAYTLTATDAGKLVRFTSASAVTLTIGTAILPGQRVDLLQDGAGTVTWAAGGGTVLAWNSSTKTRGQYAAATLFCVGTSDYRVVGNLA
jgi:hypothetical protein